MVTQDPILRPFGFFRSCVTDFTKAHKDLGVCKLGLKQKTRYSDLLSAKPEISANLRPVIFRAQSLFSLFNKAIKKKNPHQAKRNLAKSPFLTLDSYWLFLLFYQNNIVANISYSCFPLSHDISVNDCEWHRQQEKSFTENRLLCLWLSE